MKLILIPFNGGALSKKNGIEKGSSAVVKHLQSFFLKENGILPFIETEELNVNNSSLEESNEIISRRVHELDAPAIILGGDHSITYSAFKTFSKKYKNPGFIVFDSHLDCENDFSPPTHEDYLRVLIEEGHLKKENTLVVGIRNFHSNETEFAKSKKLKIYDMKELAEDGKNEVAQAIMTAARGFDALYVSVDIDVLDPAFAPGTGYTEPGGMTSRELIYFIQKLKLLKNVMMWDLVEVNPEKDVNEMTAILAAKLIIEMC
jgi:formiminoglutamase